MTVNELITQLQQCDKPDAIVRLQIVEGSDRVTSQNVLMRGDYIDVYYNDASSNEVFVEAEEMK